MSLKAGEVILFERSFTQEDVEAFTKLSGDEGIHHLSPDEQGRVVVQGLLTATLPTKVGGDHNVLARNMVFEFLRPVFTGDVIRCEVKIGQCEKQLNGRTAIAAVFRCHNQTGKEVLAGKFEGIILPD